MQNIKRTILTRAKTREMEAFYHEDIQQYKLLPPKGYKRKMRDEPEYEMPEYKKECPMQNDGDSDMMDMD